MNLLLAGNSYEGDLSQEQLRTLRDENRRLSEALERTIGERNMMRDDLRDVTESVTNLRRMLFPYYQLLQGLFGEIDRVAVETDMSPGPQAKRNVWELWKQKMPGKCAEFIDALLEHGEMTGEQLRIATRSGKQTVYDTISKLNKAGLINKNGGRFSLKQL